MAGRWRRARGETRWRIPLLTLGVASVVVLGSLLSVQLWGGSKPERLATPTQLQLSDDMTPQQISSQNDIAARVVRKAFGIKSDAEWSSSLRELEISEEQARVQLRKTIVIAAESGAKDWRKILIKFTLWIVFAGLVLLLMRRRRLTPKRRWALYSVAVVVFGIALGADPSPMGTVKDAIVLWAHNHVVFVPRLIALSVFLLMVVIFNKSICAWGCQIGALQDLIFRLNRDARDRRGLFRQRKPPFWLSNGIRILTFVTLIAVALIWSLDIIEPIDPFKIFKPSHLGWIGGAFVGVLLITSLFVYRPWCHFFCPFGLVGWLFEKLSLFRIRVDPATCIACEACQRACPSTVMGAILKQDRAVIPDCFACGSCLDACPTDAVSLSVGRRKRLPLPWPQFREEAQKRARTANKAKRQPPDPR